VELRVTVVWMAGGAVRRVDVGIEVEPTATGADLRDRLLTWVGDRGDGAGDPSGLELVVERCGVRRRLDPQATVFDAGVVSGDELLLAPPGLAAPDPAARVDDDALVALDIAAGPATGRSLRLPAGRFLLGRDPHCQLVIEDPSLSSSHLTVDVEPTGSVVITPNPEATNGTLVNSAWVDHPVRLGGEESVLAGATMFSFRPVAADPVGERDRLGQIGFNRLPYRRPVIAERILPELDPPPELPGERRFPLITILIPFIGALAIAAALRNPAYLLLAGLSPLMMGANYLSEGQRSKRTYTRDRAAFLAAVDTRVDEIGVALAAERAERFLAAPDLPVLARQAEGRLGRLWERHRGSPDVLDLRLGVGQLPSRVITTVRAGGDPELRRLAEERCAPAHHLDVVPVTVALDEHVVTGVHGEPADVAALGAALVVQAGCLHSPEDLVIAAAVPAEGDRWSWLGWLPHTRSVTSPLDGDHVVSGSGQRGPNAGAGVDDLLVRLLDVARVRAGARARDHGDGRPWPRVLIVLDESTVPDRALLAAVLDAAPAAGFVVVWMGRHHHQLPRQCRALVTAVDPVTGPSQLWFTDPDRPATGFELAGVAPAVAERVARALAPVRDASGGNAATSIPRVVSLLDAVGVTALSPATVERLWAQPRPYSLVAPLGIGADGPFAVDLVAHGPHALIAGTSGSGKSELLQTLVAGLALRHPPERLTFLFIDYKGGASSGMFADLPHTVGQVTNLDERLALRALASLRAELRRRMQVLEGRAKDLEEMRREAPADAPPSLVIVADEFATLVKEIPEFVAGMVDIAQRGRSLGIHLVLATQRPAGAVSDNILANTNLRIALRVLDAGESSSIIGAPDAAAIPVPLRGRALARTGPGAPVPFQTAWSGAPMEVETRRDPIVIRPLARPGDGAADESSLAPASGPTQLEAVVAACAAAAAARPVERPRRPWVEPLPDALALAAVWDPVADQVGADPGRFAVVGLADAPEDQTRYPVVVDLEETSGLIVFGTGGSGKTTALRTIAAGLAAQGGADVVRVHVLDFAGRSLGSLTDLPQVASVAMHDELEATARLLTVARLEIERRRRLLGEAGVESLSALRARRGEPVVPRLVILLDGYPAFHATFENGPLYPWITALHQLITDGRQVGVHVVLTASRQVGLPTALLSSISARLVLRMATVDELLGLGVSRAAAASELGDGRGFLNGTTEVQVATVSADPAGAAQTAAVADYGAQLRAAGVAVAPPLPELPATIALADVAPTAGPLRPVVGIADLTGAPVPVDLRRANLVVVGPPLSGRSTVLATVAAGLRGVNAETGLRGVNAESGLRGLNAETGLRGLNAETGPRPLLVGLGSSASPLAAVDGWDVAGFGRTRLKAAIDDAVAAVDGEDGHEVRVVVMIDCVEDLDAPDLAAALDALVGAEATRTVAVVEPATLARSFSGWIAQLKANRSILQLQPSSALDVEAVCGRRAALRPDQPFPPGRGVLVDRLGATLVQVAVPGAALGRAPQ
jgi:S-DNA-T family DNA segregation ATPase FtsK/SpoIIIE